MTQKRHQNDTKMSHKWTNYVGKISEIMSNKCHTNDTKTTPKWHQNDIKMTVKCQNGVDCPQISGYVRECENEMRKWNAKLPADRCCAWSSCWWCPAWLWGACAVPGSPTAAAGSRGTCRWRSPDHLRSPLACPNQPINNIQLFAKTNATHVTFISKYHVRRKKTKIISEKSSNSVI